MGLNKHELHDTHLLDLGLLSRYQTDISLDIYSSVACDWTNYYS